jgi:type II secretory pathway predicted ATPase ExeA
LLEKASCEDVAQRIAYYARLRLLSRDETTTYLEHRCTIAGARTLPFDKGAIDAMFEMTRGNLRAIDRLALGALDDAAKGKAKTVGTSNVTAARKHLPS